MEITKHLVGAIKRKDVKEITALVLEANGEDAKADEVREASRMTVALIDRTITPLAVDGTDDTCANDPEQETDKVADNGDAPDEKSELTEKLDGVIKAINKGKKKKAKKLLAELEDAGLKGSEIKKLKAQIKEL